MLAVDGEIRASHRRTPSDETAAGRAKGACRSKSYRVHLCARGFAFPACCTHASISSHGRTSMLIPTVTAMDERHTPDGQASAAYMRLELRRLRQWPGPCPDQCAPNRRTPPCECRSPPTWRSHLSPPPPAPLVSRRLPSPLAPDTGPRRGTAIWFARSTINRYSRPTQERAPHTPRSRRRSFLHPRGVSARSE
jgi:hypothetical protein